MRQFNSLINYYHHFIRHFNNIAASLSDLFKGADDKWKHRLIVWKTAYQLVFDQLKHAIINAPVLIQSDETKPYIIEMDSSHFGNGMILIQEDDDDKLHLITFDDKKLYDAELNYPRHKKELLAIKEALTKWCAYIDRVGHRVMSITG